MSSSLPRWVKQPPSTLDIVTAFYPETKPKDEVLRLRPCLVLDVRQSLSTGRYACTVAYGTTHLRTAQRQHLDLIVQNSTDLDMMGLPRATRFVLDDKDLVLMPWHPTYFDCWRGYSSPRIGALSLEYQKEYAWLMVKRLANED